MRVSRVVRSEQVLDGVPFRGRDFRATPTDDANHVTQTSIGWSMSAAVFDERHRRRSLGIEKSMGSPRWLAFNPRFWGFAAHISIAAQQKRKHNVSMANGLVSDVPEDVQTTRQHKAEHRHRFALVALIARMAQKDPHIDQVHASNRVKQVHQVNGRNSSVQTA